MLLAEVAEIWYFNDRSLRFDPDDARLQEAVEEADQQVFFVLG